MATAYNFIDLTGQKFNKLTVVRRTDNHGKCVRWLCRCDCGKEISIIGSSLKNGNTRSCGCIKLNDLSGRRFGSWVVIERVENKKHRTTLWRCRCDCGKVAVTQARSLTTGRSKSCGCNRAEDIVGRRFNGLTVVERDRSSIHITRWICLCDCGEKTSVDRRDLTKGLQKGCGCQRTKQNRNTLHPLWQTYQGMIDRCYEPKYFNNYKRYGGIGVKVCDRWLESFENFIADMGDKPEPAEDYSIDRYPDPYGNYEPNNCRWATMTEQARNRRNNLNVTFNGKTQCVAAWSEELGIKESTITERLKSGWSIEKTMTTPTQKRTVKKKRLLV